VWQGLHVADLAEQVVGMSAEQRLMMMQQYAHEMAG
jgi:hypothetical protein